MEFALRLVLLAVILICIFGIPLFLCFRAMARQAQLGNVDRFKTGISAKQRLTGFGAALGFPLVPIMLFRHEWIFAVGVALLAGTIFFVGQRVTKQS